jgi:hypothetical protein
MNYLTHEFEVLRLMNHIIIMIIWRIISRNRRYNPSWIEMDFLRMP